MTSDSTLYTPRAPLFGGRSTLFTPGYTHPSQLPADNRYGTARYGTSFYEDVVLAGLYDEGQYDLSV